METRFEKECRLFRAFCEAECEVGFLPNGQPDPNLRSSAATLRGRFKSWGLFHGNYCFDGGSVKKHCQSTGFTIMPDRRSTVIGCSIRGLDLETVQRFLAQHGTTQLEPEALLLPYSRFTRQTEAIPATWPRFRAVLEQIGYDPKPNPPSKPPIRSFEHRSVALFLELHCTVGQTLRIRARALYEAYVNWANAMQEYSVSHKTFGTMLHEWGYPTYMSSGAWYLGIALKAGQ